jgi:hypothetical protein
LDHPASRYLYLIWEFFAIPSMWGMLTIVLVGFFYVVRQF